MRVPLLSTSACTWKISDKVINYCEDLSENSNLAKIAANETYSVILEISSDMVTQMGGTQQTENLVQVIVADSDF